MHWTQRRSRRPAMDEPGHVHELTFTCLHGHPFLRCLQVCSLHTSLLDQKGLVALWREALLAQKVLLGLTKGYRSHPQLHRFRQSKAPVTTISAYLWAVHDEAFRRGYSFDSSKIVRKRQPRTLMVTQGQMDFELRHLTAKW